MTALDMTVEQINKLSANTLMTHLGIEFTAVGPTFIKAKMPVDDRTRQPLGLLHGGASAALAETLGSVGSVLQIDPGKQAPVGLEINANHIRAARSGFVHGTAVALHLGKRTHVWDIKIVDDEDNLVCTSRLTVMIVDR